jgi:tetrahydromethanopterin S-methyltransferase subunit F
VKSRAAVSRGAGVRRLGRSPVRLEGGSHIPLDDQRIERTLALAFARIHKEALGIAFGCVLALVLVLVTLAALTLDQGHQVPVELLAQYFAGYDRSPAGLVVAGAWGFFVGFVAGWFFAFVRNAVLAGWLLLVRARLEWMAGQDLMDQF